MVMKRFGNAILFIILFVAAVNIHAQKSRAKSKMLSLNRNTVIFKGDKNGFDFKDLKLKYQFVVCKGQVVLGVAYDKQATFTQYWKDGTSYTKQTLQNVPWPKSDQINLDHLQADLYFGSRKLGSVEIRHIPRYYKGCKGKMYEVLKYVGVNGYESFYKTNIDKLLLRSIRVMEASLFKP